MGGQVLSVHEIQYWISSTKTINKIDLVNISDLRERGGRDFFQHSRENVLGIKSCDYLTLKETIEILKI